MSYALALVTEEESTRLDAAPTTIDATITVTAVGKLLSFSSSSPLVTVQGTDLTLKPASSGQQPTTFNLLFVASTGIASFQSPAAEILLEGDKVSYPVYPNSGGSSFTLSFRNNLAPGNPRAAYSFTVFWNSVLLELSESEDPTILLDPPNS